LAVGDAVRITKPKQIFDKGYFPSRSDHIYTIEKVHGTTPEYYSLKDNDGVSVKGRFYRPELVKTVLDKSTTYRVEKIIRSRRGRNGEKEHLVKFIDYDGEFWVKNSDIPK
jgi:hypothetical protein